MCDELSTMLSDTLNVIRRIEKSSLSKIGEGKLSIVEFHLLECISNGENGCRTIGEIAEEQMVTIPTVTVAVNRLVKKGFIEKRRCDFDGRVIFVTLTELGVKMNRFHSFFHEQLLFSIKRECNNEELEVLKKCMKKLNEFFKFLDNEEEGKLGGI